MKKYMYNKIGGMLCALCILCGFCVSSCEDMLDKGNDYVIYADDHILSNPADTTTSVLGIINKLQSIAVRTNLLGEVRADLVVVNDNANTDLKDLAAIEVGDSNAYNVPRDYYSVINNCNYFLAFADSTAGNVNRNEKYFEAEIAQVHSIRAWTYLQLVLNYGRVPLVTDPVLTKLQSEADYPIVDLDGVCDYFINDLRPYYGKAYPDPGHFGLETLDPQMCFFPTQIVMGDLYLWRAALAGQQAGKAYAEAAAKAYYDYIVWDLSGKSKLYTSSRNLYWSGSSLTNDTYTLPSGSLTYQNNSRTAWGLSTSESITVIPMDSASAEGYYNELRQFYNTTHVTDWKEASISPSEVLRELSKAQVYVGYDSYSSPKTITEDKFTDEEINEGLFGDLRYQYNYSQTTLRQNMQDIDYQTIRKQNYQHVGIYRTAQLYLRLAEALNYAGYPRFAKQILTMGLNNDVIRYEVQPYYTTAADTAFLSYFDLSTSDFIPYARTYTETTDSLGVITNVVPVLRADQDECNMWGIHSRGSGLAFLNEAYAPALAPDSTDYPYAQAAQVGRQPQRADYDYPSTVPVPTVVPKPSTWDTYGNQTVTRDEYDALNAGASWYVAASSYRNYTNRDSVGRYNTYLTVTLPDYDAKVAQYEHDTDSVEAVYQADFGAYQGRLDAFKARYNAWYAAAYGAPSFVAQEQAQVDKLILDEQALELAFEGNRFYDLMRRAYWYGDDTVLSNAVARRDPAAGARLQNRANWFLRWKDKIGL